MINKESLGKLHHSERIPALMEQKENDLDWLKMSLQSAVSVEFSTIPPYLCAMWSIMDDTDPVAKSIRNVVHEEMLHMSLACNMLTSIGETPQISHPSMVPRYPGPLPGGLHPELTVELSGLTDESLKAFIEIERPPVEGDDDSTIGDFYEGIREVFNDLAERGEVKISTERQVSGPLAYMVMRDIRGVNKGIDLILDQGEGHSDSDPIVPIVDGTDELAHYYRFKEVLERKRYSGVKDGKATFDGAPFKRPETYPMAKVPTAGYSLNDTEIPEEVRKLINNCDVIYSTLLNRLQAVWEDGDQSPFVHAIETMFELSDEARKLMAIEIGNSGQNYGPCFRLL